MNVLVFDNLDELYDVAYLLTKDVILRNPNPRLGLATGGTPVPLYMRMILGNKNGDITFVNTSTFNLDEYVGLDLNHRESYHTFMDKNLFDYIDINKENVHIPSGSKISDCREYDKFFSEPVDLQILGMGANGHIGFNEPNTSFSSTTHIVKLTEQTRKDNKRFFTNDINQVPKEAITMGIKTIMSAKKIILIAFGEAKRQSLEKVLSGVIDEKTPASILNQHNNTYLLTLREDLTDFSIKF
jgi:glucosamine-6-phosphate deaminase